MFLIFFSFLTLREWNEIFEFARVIPLILHLLLLSSHKDTSELTPALAHTHSHSHSQTHRHKHTHTYEHTLTHTYTHSDALRLSLSLSEVTESCHNKHSQKLLMTFKNADEKTRRNLSFKFKNCNRPPNTKKSFSAECHRFRLTKRHDYFWVDFDHFWSKYHFFWRQMEHASSSKNQLEPRNYHQKQT